MGDTSQMSQILEHLRSSLEQQVAALGERRRQLQVSMEADVETASRQVASQQQVLDNLRYEADLLTEKLMKLRASRQDIEAELFQLKDKRIRLLEVINKLEDEEMQLVSEVNRIIHFKKSLLQEVPYFEARAKASASLAVVQDYLLASAHSLQAQQHKRAAGSADTIAVSAASWQGTANVRRPSASWIVMPTTPAGSSLPPTPGSSTSTMPPTPGVAPADSASTSEASKTSSSSTAAAAAAGVGTAAVASHAPPSDVVSGTAEAVQRLQLNVLESPGQEEQQHQQQQQQQPLPAPQTQQPQQPQQQQLDGGPFAAVTVDQLMRMQPHETATVESLPTLPEGKPFPPPGTLDTSLSSIDQAFDAMSSLGGLQTVASGARSSGSFAPGGHLSARGGKDAPSSTSGITSSTLTSRGSENMHTGSDSLRSAGSMTTGGPLGSGSFTSPATPFINLQSTDESPKADGTGAHTSSSSIPVGAASSSDTASAAVSTGQHQQGLVIQQQQQQLLWRNSRSPSQVGLGPPIQPPPPPPPPPRRAPSQNLGQLPMQQHSPPVQQPSPLAAVVATGTVLAQQQQRTSPPPVSPRAQQLQLPQLVLQAPTNVFLQQEGAQAPHSPQRLLLVQSQPLAEQSLQLQLQLAQVQQAQQQQQQQQQAQQQQVQQQTQEQQQEAQRQVAQQQQQQLMLFAEHLALPVSVGQLPQAPYDLTGSSNIDISAAFASSAVPSINSAIPLCITSVQPSSREMWVLPAGAVLLQADTTDSRQGLAPMLSLQTLPGFAGASGLSSAGAAGSGTGLSLTGSAPSHAASAAAPLVVLASPDAAQQTGGLFQLQQQIQQLQQQQQHLQGQQQQHHLQQSSDLDATMYERGQ